MSATATFPDTLQKVLDRGKAGEWEGAAQLAKLGSVLTPVSKTYTGLASAAAHNITDAAHGSAVPILVPIAVRVTAGAAAAGLRMIGDPAATPSATVATLSADGKTLTFEAGVTGFVLVYMQQATVALSTIYPTQ
jgi:hypothetical protein